MANICGQLHLTISINGRPSEIESTYTWAGGSAVLTISTVLPDRGLAAELISTYVGHPQTSTIVTHLMLGPVGREPTIHTAEHTHDQLDPVEQPRECAYNHAGQLLEALTAAGHRATVHLDEQSFTQLERVE